MRNIMLCKHLIKIILLIPTLIWANIYNITDDYKNSVEYVMDKRGDCEGEHYTFADKGAIAQAQCENLCNEEDKCSGYSFKSGSCVLKKNMNYCGEDDWIKTNGYTYYAKPLDVNYFISDDIITMTPDNPPRENNNKFPSKFCLHINSNAAYGDRLFSTKCEVPDHLGQTFIIAIAAKEEHNLLPVYDKNGNFIENRYEHIKEDGSIDYSKAKYKLKLDLTNATDKSKELCVDLDEYLYDQNPTRIWDCELSNKSKIRKERQYYKLTKELVDAYINRVPLKTQLSTNHILSIAPGYVLLNHGDCNGNDIKSLDNIGAAECASECDNMESCKGFNYEKSIKRCVLKSVADCETRNLVDIHFFSKIKAIATTP